MIILEKSVNPSTYLEEILHDVKQNKFGTKHKIELMLRLEFVINGCKSKQID